MNVTIPADEIFPECFPTEYVKKYGCHGRNFGGWAKCPHGMVGYLDELEREADRIRELLRNVKGPITWVKN